MTDRRAGESLFAIEPGSEMEETFWKSAPEGWAKSSEAKLQLRLLGIWILLCLVVPPLVREFFPFSSFHVFVDNPSRYATYTVLSPQGEPLSTAALGLHRNYIGNGGYSLALPSPHRGGLALPANLELFGQVASEEEIRRYVSARLANRSEVRVRQTVVGALDERRVGVVGGLEIVVAGAGAEP